MSGAGAAGRFFSGMSAVSERPHWAAHGQIFDRRCCGSEWQVVYSGRIVMRPYERGFNTNNVKTRLRLCRKRAYVVIPLKKRKSKYKNDRSTLHREILSTVKELFSFVFAGVGFCNSYSGCPPIWFFLLFWFGKPREQSSRRELW